MITVAELAHLVNGRLDMTDGAIEVTAPAFNDTRVPEPGGVFVALPGEHVDGHTFAAEAIAGGAAAVLASRSVGVPAIIVDDVLIALGKWAAHHRRSLPAMKTIGITGSQGKTTTKDLLAEILEQQGETVSPPGSYNNDLGVPLTLLRCTPDTQFCILEMGARHEGDIARLAKMADLDVGAVLVIGSAHLGEFGSREAIARTKGEMVKGLRPNAVAVLGTFDELTPALPTSARTVRFGPAGQVRAEQVRVRGGLAHFTLEVEVGSSVESAVVDLHFPGEHQVANALAAAACAWALGVGLTDIAAALSQARSRSRMRMEMTARADGLLVINDAYNANPESMKAALRTVTSLARERGGASWAVLGEMRELGASSMQEHDAIGRLAVRLDISRLIVVGVAAKAIHMGAAHEGSWGEESVFVETMDEAIALLAQARPSDVVLVKASRSVGLERVAHAVLGLA